MAALEDRAPAVTAALVDASDKLSRAAKRYERAKQRANETGDDDEDDFVDLRAIQTGRRG